MKLVGDAECYSKMPSAKYGFDAYGNKLKPLGGYLLIPYLDELEGGDRPFDVYAGWLGDGYFNRKYHHNAISDGRWTAWARRITPACISEVEGK